MDSHKRLTIPLQSSLRISTSRTPAFPRGTSGLDTSLWTGQRSLIDFCVALSAGNGCEGFAGSPEERPHGNPSLEQHGTDELGQIQPDVRNIYRHVLRNLQHLQQPEQSLPSHLMCIYISAVKRLIVINRIQNKSLFT